MPIESLIQIQTSLSTELIAVDVLTQKIRDVRDLLVQHQRNLIHLRQLKANYAAGEEQLRLFNQIDQENLEIGRVQSELNELFLRKLWQLALQIDLSVEEIKRLYRSSRPSNFAPRFEPASLLEALAIFWNMRDSEDKALPLFEFVGRLAHCNQGQPLAGQLKAWMMEAVQYEILQVQLGDVEQLKQRLEAEHAHQPADELDDSALLIEIEIDPNCGAGPLHYLVKIYFWQDGRVVECWHKQENDASGQKNRSYKLHEIPNLLYRILSEHEERPATIEFLLPKDLLAEAIDQWASEADPIPICLEYRVVVRSQERIRKKELSKWRQAWQEKWRLFHQELDKRDVFWLHHPGEYERQLLTQRLILAKEKGACLGLAFVPPVGRHEQDNNDLLIPILRAGVPIMAWSRQCEQIKLEASQMKAELAIVLCKENLDRLPAVVQRLRTSEDLLDRIDHLGKRIALFWDDPQRMPPPEPRTTA